MADFKKRISENLDGLFFVDDTCIDCDTCRQLAPETFAESGDYAIVTRQPENEIELRKATRALLACPTGSIGTTEKIDTLSIMDDFPMPITMIFFITALHQNIRLAHQVILSGIRMEIGWWIRLNTCHIS